MMLMLNCLSSAGREQDALSNVLYIKTQSFNNFRRRHRNSLGFIKKKDAEAQSKVKQLVQGPRARKWHTHQDLNPGSLASGPTGSQALLRATGQVQSPERIVLCRLCSVPVGPQAGGSVGWGQCGLGAASAGGSAED